jgi:SAM-dependent methyltransferase
VSLLKRLIPYRLKAALKVLLGRSIAVSVPSGKRLQFSCSVCGRHAVDFEPIPANIFQELDLHEHVYSSFQYETCNLEHFACSRCGASDRDRLYALYLRGVLSTDARVSVLDIAPSAPLTGFLRQFHNAHVRSADLQMSGVDDTIDITDMSTYADGQFDGFICSHVLEHIPNDIAAMKELHRVLRPGGWGIAMVPIHLGLQRVHEDPSITDEAGRWKYFAQHDHVRLYSKQDFVGRLESVGFIVEQLGRPHFGDDLFSRYGIHQRSVLYVVSK